MKMMLTASSPSEQELKVMNLRNSENLMSLTKNERDQVLQAWASIKFVSLEETSPHVNSVVSLNCFHDSKRGSSPHHAKLVVCLSYTRSDSKMGLHQHLHGDCFVSDSALSRSRARSSLMTLRSARIVNDQPGKPRKGRILGITANMSRQPATQQKKRKKLAGQPWSYSSPPRHFPKK